MALLFNKLKVKEIAKVPVRYRNGPNHWATLRKKIAPKDKALEHFNEFYDSVYGHTWPKIREALLQEGNKYMAVVNNFSDTERIQSNLESHGAINLRSIYNSYRELSQQQATFQRKRKHHRSSNVQEKMESFISETESSEIKSLYPSDHELATESLQLKENDEVNLNEKPLDPVQLRSIETELNTVTPDTSRIINPGVNLTGLYEYVPATKLKGMSDWVLESDYYRYYTKGSDFSVQIEKEPILSFPEHLHVYTFEQHNDSRFPSPKKGSTGVLDYYLFDGGSILPVLALDIQPNDVVLDMCAAPGGKALTILQTLLPKLMVANDISQSRTKRIRNVLEQFTSGIDEAQKMVYVTEQDARIIEDKDIYNKILVDVPCTTDRHVLHSDENNLFRPDRVKERLRIPELQTEILTNALKLVKLGGTVVYSTCTLSPVQNDGVVQMAMKTVWEESDSLFVVKDMSRALEPLKCLYKFGNIQLKYGHIAIPTLRNNWGPMYFCKIVRVQ